MVRGALRACSALLLVSPLWAQSTDDGGQSSDESPFPAGLPEPLELDPEPHHLRTLGGLALGLGGFAAGYWTLQATQQPDWDYPSVGGRFDGSAWRFDNNQLIINYWLHPLAGAEMYALARANHHDPLTAAAYSTLGSFVWEFVFEYRELVSLNDVLATSFPGIPIGEFLHKLGVYMDSARAPSFGMKVAQWTLAPGHQYDRFTHGASPPEVAERDALGLRADIWHDFGVRGGVAISRAADRTELGFGYAAFEGRLVSLSGYRKPGTLSRSFGSLDFTSLELGVEASREGPGLSMGGETLLVGWYGQRLAPRSRSAGERAPAFSGTSAVAGLALGYSYLESYQGGFPELFGAFHMPGARLEARAESAIGHATLGLRVTPDFVGVGAYGYDTWQALHPGELGKHILRNQGYYYGFGGSGSMNAEARLGPLLLRGDVFLGRYRSTEGLNRWQERITVDVPAGTDFLSYRASAHVRPGSLPLSVGASLELRRWNTFIGEVTESREALIRGAELQVRF
jgi:hypothetical protein